MKSWRTALVAFVIDAALVLVFVLVGRRSHGESAGLTDLFTTLWPFLVTLLASWLVTGAWRKPLVIVWPGVPIWLMTVALGMLIRTSAGQGVQPSFIAVAFVVLGVFLVGWRLVALPFVRRSASAPSAARDASAQLPAPPSRHS